MLLAAQPADAGVKSAHAHSNGSQHDSHHHNGPVKQSGSHGDGSHARGGHDSHSVKPTSSHPAAKPTVASHGKSHSKSGAKSTEAAAQQVIAAQRSTEQAQRTATLAKSHSAQQRENRTSGKQAISTPATGRVNNNNLASAKTVGVGDQTSLVGSGYLSGGTAAQARKAAEQAVAAAERTVTHLTQSQSTKSQSTAPKSTNKSGQKKAVVAAKPAATTVAQRQTGQLAVSQHPASTASTGSSGSEGSASQFNSGQVVNNVAPAVKSAPPAVHKAKVKHLATQVAQAPSLLFPEATSLVAVSMLSASVGNLYLLVGGVLIAGLALVVVGTRRKAYSRD
jgi:hypothetical protein